MTSQHEAVHVDGGLARTDSIAVDAVGKLCQALHDRLQQVRGAPRHCRSPAKDAGGPQSATSIAIARGGRAAYMTVSGSSGGYIQRFTSIAEDLRQSNGG
ncbi:hypothetical protein PUR34_05080 [Streptomyces sp. JV185]|uniref:hypothetical protein n=1 Tax=Streptomyces sp. JV185 TaxID=858638 RepID=UPI002E782B03|nr:hypothetical protein [Streptomyces sp. JV185]MEE1767568.1 hypothetical protein [Streptomyces sp. JV185]